MKGYVDGFVIPIKKKNVKAYLKMARLGCRIWMKYGALDYWECVGDELTVKMGPPESSPRPMSPFIKKFSLKPDETVIFSWILFKSKAHRNSVNAKVMKDPAMQMENFDPKEMPFDDKRMLYGGFSPIVSAKRRRA
ncbi:MAG: DUF1428 domain-containing protein [Candidatus Aenigmarchaeota archaeon]|nr:DUF1428 domain-containing protein [Candidatus Aenigmarchaeota archaeon]